MTKAIKLNSPMKWRHIAKVTVRRFGRFPIDMLRYDNCNPFREVDSSKIEEMNERVCPDGTVSIFVECYSESQQAPWTVDRWRSFGTVIEPVTESEARQEEVIIED